MTVAFSFSFSEFRVKSVSIGGLTSLVLFILTVAGIAAAFALKGQLWGLSNMARYEMSSH